MTSPTVASVLTELGSVVTQAIAWAGDIVSFIMANPLILIFAGLPIIGVGIGMVKRMISL